MAKRTLDLALSPRFQLELQSQITWLADRNLNVAVAAEQRVRVAIRRLSKFPELGRLGRVEGTRELSVPHTRFIIAYRVLAERVEIIALRHSKQQWPSSF